MSCAISLCALSVLSCSGELSCTISLYALSVLYCSGELSCATSLYALSVLYCVDEVAAHAHSALVYCTCCVFFAMFCFHFILHCFICCLHIVFSSKILIMDTYNPDTSISCHCGKPDSYEPTMVECEICSHWSHPGCEGFSPEEVVKISPFLCKRCRPESIRELTKKTSKRARQVDVIMDQPHQSTSSGAAAVIASVDLTTDVEEIVDHLPEEPVPEGEYEVEKILSHRMKNGRLQYLVKWLRYEESDNSWEPAPELVNAHLLVTKYRLENNVSLEKVWRPARLGFVGPSSAGDSNWMTLKDIIQAIQVYSKKRDYKRELDVVIFDGDMVLDSDVILLIQAANHCLVGLYIDDQRVCYMADGQNKFQRSQTLRTMVSDLLKVSLRSVSFDQQRCDDHCGTTAVLLALEFKRIYSSGLEIPSILTVPKGLQNRLISIHHKEGSSKSKSWRPVGDMLSLSTCDKCGKTFKGRDKRGYLSHVRLCNV